MTHDHPGCPRCRMDLICFKHRVVLPRFTMEAGEHWNLPQSRYTDQGDAQMGGALAPAGSFTISTPDFRRACHNGKRCPGNTADD